MPNRIGARKYQWDIASLPNAIPNLAFWVKSDALVKQGTTGVTDWFNIADTASKYNLTQSNSAAFPARGTTPLNGYCGVTGSSLHYMNFATLTGFLNAKSGVTTFAVIKSSTGSAQNVFSIAQGNAAATNARFGIGITAANAIQLYGSQTDSNSSVPTLNGGTHTTSPEIIHATWDVSAQTANLYLNGANVATSGAFSTAGSFPATDPNSANILNFISFNSDPLLGDLFELIIYDRVLTVLEQLIVKSYLSRKYSIVVS